MVVCALRIKIVKYDSFSYPHDCSHSVRINDLPHYPALLLLFCPEGSSLRLPSTVVVAHSVLLENRTTLPFSHRATVVLAPTPTPTSQCWQNLMLSKCTSTELYSSMPTRGQLCAISISFPHANKGDLDISTPNSCISIQ